MPGLGHLMLVVEVDELAVDVVLELEVDVVLELVEVSLYLIVVEVGLHLYDQRKKLGLVV